MIKLDGTLIMRGIGADVSEEYDIKDWWIEYRSLDPVASAGGVRKLETIEVDVKQAIIDKLKQIKEQK